MDHNAILHFPNGKGYTHVTQEYLDTKNERDAICDLNEGESRNDLEPDDYQRWDELDNKLMELQAKGHCGASVRY